MKGFSNIKDESTSKPAQKFSQEAKQLIAKRKDAEAKGHHCQGGGGWGHG